MSYNKEKRKVYLEANKESIKLKKKQYYIDNQKKLIDDSKNYREQNKNKINDYYKSKRKKDPLYKLKGNTRNLIKNSINRSFKKPNKTEEILNCTLEQFKLHLESLWEPWMNWDNYGLYNGELNYGWDIDHIIPLVTANELVDVIKLNHYTNLQPLCSKVNRDIKNKS